MNLSLPGSFAVLLALSASLLAQTPAPPDAAPFSDAIGAPIFADNNLWDDNPYDVSTRLSWTKDSQTSYGETYRLYPDFSTTMFGGARPNAVSMHALAGKPAFFTMVFANSQDAARDSLIKQGQVLPENAEERQKMITKAAAKISKEIKEAVKKDYGAITAKLTSLLGPAKRETLGQGGARQVAERWDWNGHAFLLSAPKEEYVILKIMPSANVNVVPKADAAFQEAIKSRATKKPNGDVVLSEVPPLEQGPKGLSIPANWERCLTYLGLQADLYEIAMAAGTQPGGNYSDQVTEAGSEIARAAGRRVDTAPGGRVSVRTVQKMIDMGLPVMWSMNVVDKVEYNVNLRTGQRASMQDMKLWKENLKSVRKELRTVRAADGKPHTCIIVGYNADTGELAILDSGSTNTGERWITEDEAQTISGRDLTVVTW